MAASLSSSCLTILYQGTPYGEPKYTRLILDKLIDLKPDGSFRLNQEYFNYYNPSCYLSHGCLSVTVWVPKLKPWRRGQPCRNALSQLTVSVTSC